MCIRDSSRPGHTRLLTILRAREPADRDGSSLAQGIQAGPTAGSIPTHWRPSDMVPSSSEHTGCRPVARKPTAAEVVICRFRKGSAPSRKKAGISSEKVSAVRKSVGRDEVGRQLCQVVFPLAEPSTYRSLRLRPASRSGIGPTRTRPLYITLRGERRHSSVLAPRAENSPHVLNVGDAGLEPATSCMSSRRSSQLS